MEKKLTYRDAGVDIDAGNLSVKLIKDSVKATYRPEVLGDLGGFGGLFAMSTKYKEPVLVSGTDGVGTKLRLAFILDKHDTIGQDAVAMCVNDILVQGAEPLFFLDYLAVGKLEPEQVADVVKGVANACKESGCALIGGETAEMAGFYAEGEYDIAGFAVGAVEKSKIITSEKVKAGDVIISYKVKFKTDKMSLFAVANKNSIFKPSSGGSGNGGSSATVPVKKPVVNTVAK